MEKPEYEIPGNNLESPKSHGLWLTDRLLVQLLESSKIALPVLAIALIAGISLTINSIFLQLYNWSQKSYTDFYLLEGDNLFRVFNLLTSLLIIYFFSRAVLEGHKAWRLLRQSETDDDALLEGTERLGKMFRWLTLWGYVVIGTVILTKFWVNILG